MKFDGNYRQETWETLDGVYRTTFVVDDGQVTIDYDLLAEVLTERDMERVDA